jgi:hypothetical protein
MKKLCLFLVVASVVLSAAEPADQTLHLKNGRFWNVLESAENRHAFVLGLMDGWQLRGDTQDIIKGSVIIAMSGSGRFTTVDLTNMVTSIYSEAENLTLPVGWVVMGCLAVQRGETTRDIVMMTLRRHLATVMARKDELSSAEIDPVELIIGLRPQ